MYFVIRDTEHPQEDLARNFSGFAGGSCNGEQGGATAEEARANFASFIDCEISDVSNDFKFHPAYGEFVAVDYYGLGAFSLDAETKEEALVEAANYDSGDLACCVEAGDGHFNASECIGFEKVRDGRYVFILK